MKDAIKSIAFRDEAELYEVAETLLEIGKGYHVWLFQGDMGAGKTTLIKSICKVLGVEETVTSPTFAIVNEYLSSRKEVLYHFDFYRINDETEALDIGIEEYFDSGCYCFVEWPNLISSLWPMGYLLVNLEVKEDGSRELMAEKIG